MRVIYDIFTLAFVALGAVCIGIGIAIIGDASLDMLLGTGRYPHPDAMVMIGVIFVVMGAFGAWWNRFVYNFFTMTRIRP